MSEQNNKETTTSTSVASSTSSTSSPSPSTSSSSEDLPHDQTDLSVKSPLELAKEEAEKWKNDYLYLKAEFENFRKHSIKERSDLTKYGAERFLRDFLEVMDNFDRALMSVPTPENLSSYVMGVQMIAKEIRSLLNKHGVTSEDCLGLPFDPSKHEALGTELSKDVSPGHIVKVVKAPYKLYDKLLRPAQVLVASDEKG
jgi:molecular chaperone GrpE